MRSRLALMLVVGVMAAAGWVAAAGAASAVPAPRIETGLWEGNPDLTKVSSDLLTARVVANERLPGIDTPGVDPLVDVVEGAVLVDVSLEVLTPEVLAELERAGLVVEFASFEYARVSGRVPLDRLDEVAAVEEVATIHPEYGAITNIGSVIDQADVLMKSSAARTFFGVDGTGVTVGVISDSFYEGFGSAVVTGSGCGRTVTGMANQVSGDLPTSVVVLDNGTGGIDEGAAMAELIHDVAPGAAIQFHTSNPSQAAFAAGITGLRACGADVIVDDIFYLAAPMFQDGVIAQAAQDAVLAGVPYFSAAGNNGMGGVDQVYHDVKPAQEDTGVVTGNDFHLFSGGDEFAEIEMDENESLIAVLQWAEPFDGALGSGASTDLDLILYDDPDDVGDGLGRTSSRTRQGCGVDPGDPSGDPLEVLSDTNWTTDNTVYLAVHRHCGTADVRFRIVVFVVPSDVGLESSVFRDSTIFGHPAAEGVLAVAATDFCEVETAGNHMGTPSVIDVEPFSSLGGALPIFFDRSGTAIPGGPDLRVKPEITAPDGSNTTFFGMAADPGCGEDDGLPNFFGTSAAAPHAAAVAALMLDLEATLTPDDVRRILASTATDIAASGFDFLSGDGLINALEALGHLPPLDFGDAPAPYATRRVADGARHVQDDLLFLGAGVDTETDAQPNATATGDDLANSADEDGVIWATAAQAGALTALQITTSQAGVLNAWVDFNRDGDWDDPIEHIFPDVPMAGGLTTMTFTPPGTLNPGPSFARFRFDSTGGLAPTGWTADGEVEDYAVYLYPPQPQFPYPPQPQFPGTGTVTAVDGQASAVLPRGGGMVCTDHLGDGPTPDVPVEVCVTTPIGGFIDILPDLPGGPGGFTMLGTGALITAPDASPQEPLMLRFLIEGSTIPEWVDHESIAVFRDGAEVAVCSGPAGFASPDPCVASTRVVAGGDVEITVYSSVASLWSFGVPAPTCRGRVATIVGDDEPNVLRGTSGDDVIWAGDGDDVVHGRGGNDTICLGSGDDTANGGTGRDLILGGKGSDLLRGGSGRDRLFGGKGPDDLRGRGGNDLLKGNKGTDTGNGGLGTDTCVTTETVVHCEL